MKKNIFNISFVLIAMLIIATSCMTFRKSDAYIMDKYQNFNHSLSIDQMQIEGKNLHYMLFKNTDNTKPLLVLIHGAPGSITALSDFMLNGSLRNNFSLLFVDRPGYGRSDYGKYLPFAKQSELIMKLIDKLRIERNVFIVGHSYGATIAGYAAIEAPFYLKGSIMLAPALDPENEKYFWFSKLGKWKLTRWLANGALKVATDEKYNHAAELQEIKNTWSKINIPILHVHGDKDNVVPFLNIEFSQKLFPMQYYSKYVWKGMNHFIPFDETEKTIMIINTFVDSLAIKDRN